ncbi:hypothetical protein PUN28_000766 [Cardiocondyla obscurior]|uniref:Uncharacterized protein n=1 Tax=Cardiocondyla obscurior TaxID=286306 RepID=A0AAW2H0Z5_9HYME
MSERVKLHRGREKLESCHRLPESKNVIICDGNYDVEVTYLFMGNAHDRVFIQSDILNAIEVEASCQVTLDIADDVKETGNTIKINKLEATDSISYSQQKAIDKYKVELEELYQEMIHIDIELLPYTPREEIKRTGEKVKNHDKTHCDGHNVTEEITNLPTGLHNNSAVMAVM